MSNGTHAGGASALPIARAFLNVGGRLMIGPTGRLEIGGGLRWALASTSAREARRSFVVERRLCRRLRNPTFARSVASLVAMHGKPLNGWLVMERAD